jgi:hypothetical protein
MIRRATIAIATAASAAVLAAGCGGGGGGSDELASVAPADAPLYLESVVRPEGEQSDAINSLASRVGGIDDSGAAIVQQLDAGLAQSGADLNYADDISPWLGERASIFFQSLSGDTPDFAVAFETTDTGAAQDFLDKVGSATPDIEQETYNGVDYIAEPSSPYAAGIVGDFLVFGSLDAFKAAVDASSGSSLSDSSEFEDGVAAVDSDNVGLGYVDSSQAIAAATATMNPLEAQALKPLLTTLASGPTTFSVAATTDAATVDVSLPSGSALQFAGGDLVGKAPADAWFAIGMQHLGSTLEGALKTATSSVPGADAALGEIQRESGIDPREALSWMQDGYAFVGGTSEKTIDLGLVVQSSDSQASSRDIAALRGKFQADADAELGPPPQGADEGFSASAPESPQAIQAGQFDNKVVGALGPGQPAEDTLHPDRSLGDDPAFKAGEDALGSDFSPLAFVSLSPFFVVAQEGGSANDPQYLAAKPYLENLDYLLVGTSSDSGRTTARFVVGAK